MVKNGQCDWGTVSLDKCRQLKIGALHSCASSIAEIVRAAVIHCAKPIEAVACAISTSAATTSWGAPTR